MSKRSKESLDRIERLKNKFRELGIVGQLREYVRYERAKDGTLPHKMPPEFVDETLEALGRLIREHYRGDGRKIIGFLDVVRGKESKPFPV